MRARTHAGRTGALLDLLRDPERIWSPHGLRSLSAKDRFYQVDNAPGDAPYWRGYVPRALYVPRAPYVPRALYVPGV
jgi:hypothetical protein